MHCVPNRKAVLVVKVFQRAESKYLTLDYQLEMIHQKRLKTEESPDEIRLQDWILHTVEVYT